MFIFPVTSPKEEPAAVWLIQKRLLSEAEQRLGPRSAYKQIYQPGFREDGPVVVNTPSLDGAFAVLSPAAQVYWPTLVYELAHETVHLLNPQVGSANFLEEGIAVAFSIEMSIFLTPHPQTPQSTPYLKALSLLQHLGQYAYVGRTVREKYHSLGRITASQLAELFPDTDPEIARALVRPFPHRSEH